MLRALLKEFHHPLSARLALVGAFGYDLLFQFDPIERRLPRDDVKDLHLFLCDDIYFMDRKKEHIERYQFDFARGEDYDARPSAHRGKLKRAKKAKPGPIVSDHTAEEYMAKVETVREGMRQGDYYEVVLRQTFRAPYSGSPCGVVRADSAGESEPVRVLSAVGRRTTDRRVAGDVRARRGAAHRDLPHCGHGAAHRRSAARRR